MYLKLHFWLREFFAFQLSVLTQFICDATNVLRVPGGGWVGGSLLRCGQLMSWAMGPSAALLHAALQIPEEIK